MPSAKPCKLSSIGPSGGHSSINWKQRLGSLLQYPSFNVQPPTFIRNTVAGAMDDFAQELRTHGLIAHTEISDKGDQATLTVMHGEEIDFQYCVHIRDHRRPDTALVSEASDTAEDHYFRAEVHLHEGSQDYDLMGWTQEQVLNDILEQYEKHLHFLHVLR